MNRSIEDQNKKILLTWPESREFWSEKLMYSISGYLERVGFESGWEGISDMQD